MFVDNDVMLTCDEIKTTHSRYYKFHEYSHIASIASTIQLKNTKQKFKQNSTKQLKWNLKCVINLIMNGAQIWYNYYDLS